MFQQWRRASSSQRSTAAVATAALLPWSGSGGCSTASEWNVPSWFKVQLPGEPPPPLKRSLLTTDTLHLSSLSRHIRFHVLWPRRRRETRSLKSVPTSRFQSCSELKGEGSSEGLKERHVRWLDVRAACCAKIGENDVFPVRPATTPRHPASSSPSVHANLQHQTEQNQIRRQ